MYFFPYTNNNKVRQFAIWNIFYSSWPARLQICLRLAIIQSEANLIIAIFFRKDNQVQRRCMLFPATPIYNMSISHNIYFSQWWEIIALLLYFVWSNMTNCCIILRNVVPREIDSSSRKFFFKSKTIVLIFLSKKISRNLSLFLLLIRFLELYNNYF